MQMWLPLIGEAPRIFGKQTECAVTPIINTLPHTASNSLGFGIIKAHCGRNDKQRENKTLPLREAKSEPRGSQVSDRAEHTQS